MFPRQIRMCRMSFAGIILVVISVPTSWKKQSVFGKFKHISKYSHLNESVSFDVLNIFISNCAQTWGKLCLSPRWSSNPAVGL